VCFSAASPLKNTPKTILEIASNNITEDFKRRSRAKTWKMVKIVWTDSGIEDSNAIGESLVELPEPKPQKKKKLHADISSLYCRVSIYQ